MRHCIAFTAFLAVGRAAFIQSVLPASRVLAASSTGLSARAQPLHSAAARMTATATPGGAVAAGNPLLEQEGLPKFTDITADHVGPALTQLLADFNSGLASLEADLDAGAEPSWAAVVDRLEEVRAPLEYAWGVVGHLMGVKNSDALREAHQAAQPEVVKAMSAYSQSKAVYQAFQALEASPDLDASQRRIVEKQLKDMELSGVGLDGAAQQEFNDIKLELASLSTKFSNHVLDDTKAFKKVLTDPEAVKGFPQSLKAATAAAAKAAGHGDEATADAGPWLITLDMPVYLPLMQNAEHRPLREELYRAFISRAGSGENDNSAILTRVLELRQRQAELLGKANYAEVSLSSKMAGTVAAVDDLIAQLREPAFAAAQRELEALRAFAKDQGQAEPLELWDTTFWAERRREALYAYSDEELRAYFSLDKVLTGLFGVIERLFGATVEAADGEAEVWHPDVRFFRVKDKSGALLASFFLDPYARPAEKRGGAWMAVCLGRSALLDRKPVAYLTCNGSPPVGGTPSLMSFRDVETLFHEMGHGLQHMLTTVPYADAAGINNVEWDAVELPSQFMENWCYHKPTLDSFAAHYETGEALPAELFAKVLKARHYNAGLGMLRQLFFSKLDMELHAAFRAGGKETPFDVQQRLAADFTVIPPLPEDKFLCSFSHIFAGGYAAGYYSYKWAEVMAADAFGAFEEEGGLEDAERVQNLGAKFRDTVLALGGSRHPSEVFQTFRGREPSPQTLLRQSGLLAGAANA